MLVEKDADSKFHAVVQPATVLLGFPCPVHAARLAFPPPPPPQFQTFPPPPPFAGAALQNFPPYGV